MRSHLPTLLMIIVHCHRPIHNEMFCGWMSLLEIRLPGSF